VYPSPLSCSLLVRHHPVREGPSHCPAAATVGLRPFLLAAHSPSTAFGTRPTKAWHRVPGPAAVEVPRLVCCVAVRVTWLEAYASGRVSFARGSRRGDVLSRTVVRLVSGGRNQKRLLTPRHRLFAVWHRLPHN